MLVGNAKTNQENLILQFILQSFTCDSVPKPLLVNLKFFVVYGEGSFELNHVVLTNCYISHITRNK